LWQARDGDRLEDRRDMSGADNAIAFGELEVGRVPPQLPRQAFDLGREPQDATSRLARLHLGGADQLEFAHTYDPNVECPRREDAKRPVASGHPRRSPSFSSIEEA